MYWRALSKDGVKRVEPLRGSERFLDSLSRIPEGNPTTNEPTKSIDGVKRVEPLRGSERFLDSLSRIPEGNPRLSADEPTKSIDDLRSSTDFKGGREARQ